jgi:glycosyltransferase involved in cell wall biosynthesis
VKSPRLFVLRGTSANPWDLRPWEELTEEFDITVLVPPNNMFDTSRVRLRRTGIRTVGGQLNRGGALGRLAIKALGERYIGLKRALAGADIVHAAELGTWYTAQAAGLREALGFRLAVTAWETIPLLDAYRNVRTRPYRRRVLEATDMFLPATQRARSALLLEGVAADRIRVVAPGVDLERYTTARASGAAGETQIVLSIGRLVWEKGHQDVLRALALLRARGRMDARVLIVGTGPEELRLRRVISDLGLEGVADLRGWVPHEELKEVYACASCLVLASQGTWAWEEQFGMVLVEAMAAHLPLVAAASGAIPEVIGDAGVLFAPGDWVGLADALEAGPLAGQVVPAAVVNGHVQQYSARSAADRLRMVYCDLLA